MRLRHKSAAEREAREREFFARQIGRTRCALCSWEFVGTFGEGHRQAIADREREHPAPESAKGRKREREERALELRLAGRKWKGIADELGVAE